jgi:uncharacterized membrane protein YhhN
MTAALVTFTAVMVIGLVWATSEQRPVARLLKMAASTGFIGVAVSVGAGDSAYGRVVLGALALSWLGDLLLSYESRAAFLGGLVAFLLAHLAYIVAFAIRGIDGTWVVIAGIVVAITAVFVWRWLERGLDRSMRAPVAAYVLIISVMVAAAFGTMGAEADPKIGIGAVAFFLSDIAVARDQFITPGFANRAVGLPLYYIAQVLLALSARG